MFKLSTPYVIGPSTTLRARVVVVACALVVCATEDRLITDSSAQERWRREMTGFELPDELFVACSLERLRLDVNEIARNSEYGPVAAERVEGGWLVYDRWTEQVVELDNDLRKVAEWGREGEGPMEYRSAPPGFGKTASGQVFVVENTAPASVMLFGADSVEHQIVLPAASPRRVQHVIDLGDTFFLARQDGIFEAVWGQRSASLRWDVDRDFGIQVGIDGQPPRFKMRKGPDGTLYVAALAPSWIWSLAADAEPTRFIRRCVPKQWQNVHSAAPRMGGRNPLRISTDTMDDFLVLPTGQALVLGGLEVDAPAYHSLELYDTDGALAAAWILPVSRIHGTFDPKNPNRLLVWGRGLGNSDEGARLIEVSGNGYPNR